ncbi:MAG: hypothetical protein LBE59_06485 [Nevskiaceae bacterium]|nr:hypothetical protein [Nevskiaceae bacterium]
MILAAAAACSSVGASLPWGAAPAATVEPVHELQVTVPADRPMPVVLQFWERNTLVVDLQGAAASGQIRLSRQEGRQWPVRIGFRMSATRIQQLEVRGDQRIVLSVAGRDGAPVTAQLPVGVVGAGTPSLTVSWGASGAF